MKKFLNRIIINEIFSFINENHKNNNDSEKEFVARYATHIENDLKRGWSSWTFGNYGFHGTKEELKKAMQTAIDNNHDGAADQLIELVGNTTALTIADFIA